MIMITASRVFSAKTLPAQFLPEAHMPQIHIVCIEPEHLDYLSKPIVEANRERFKSVNIFNDHQH